MTNLVESLNKFGFETLQLTNTDDITENTIFSPYSAFVCVLMSNSLFQSETRSEILQSLQIPDTQVTPLLQQLNKLIENERSEKVSTSNKIWANQAFNFESSTFSPNEKILKIPIEKVDFPHPACERINAEVNKTTRGMIPKLVEPSDVGPDSAIVLMNAIYFKSDWQTKFDIDPESHNQEIKNFTLANGEKIHVNMLESYGRKIPFSENDNFQVVSIPYINNEYDFVIILPKDESNGYEHLKKLKFETVTELLSNLNTRKVDVKLPKFSFENKIKLNSIFQSLGMEKAFTHRAECTDPNVSYCISSIIQKAKIVLDENGTEAAAATGMIMMCCAIINEPPTPQVFANHPFAYLLRNRRSGSILFEGFVKNPTE